MLSKLQVSEVPQVYNLPFARDISHTNTSSQHQRVTLMASYTAITWVRLGKTDFHREHGWNPSEFWHHSWPIDLHQQPKIMSVHISGCQKFHFTILVISSWWVSAVCTTIWFLCVWINYMVNYPEKGVYELIECKDNHHWPESVKTDMHGILPG